MGAWSHGSGKPVPPLDPVWLSSRSEKEEVYDLGAVGSDECLENPKPKERRPILVAHYVAGPAQL